MLYWVLSLGLAAGIAWVWWELSRDRRSAPRRSAPPVAKRVETPPLVRLPTNPPPAAQPAPIVLPPTNPPPAPPASRPPITNPAPVLATTNPPPLPPPPPATNALGTGGVARVEAPVRTNEFPRCATNWFEAQLALDRLGLSPGSIDGAPGSQTRSALRAFQKRAGLPSTGEFDDATRSNLVLTAAPLRRYRVTDRDLAQLQPVSHTWVGKSRQTALDFETLVELVSEGTHSHPRFVRAINPQIADWNQVGAGTELILPDATPPPAAHKAAQVVIQLDERVLEAWDAEGHLLAHFPCSIAQHVDKRPVGDLRVTVLIPNPTYTFNPEIFPESEEARHLRNKLILPAGPNNPVGVGWIGLNRPGYGIHGTPNPEQVGRTESHGCFRLANWNVRYLLDLAWIGMPVKVTK